MCENLRTCFFLLLGNFTNSEVAERVLRILIHISNCCQTSEIMEKTLSDKNEPYYHYVSNARRFAPRAAYAARYVRSGRKSTSNYYAKRTEVHDD